MAREQKLSVVISGDASQLSRAFAKATADGDKFSKKTEAIHARVGKSFAGMAKHAVGAGVAMVGAYASIAGAKNAVNTTESLAKSTLTLSKNFGLTVKTASEWAAVAQTRGIDGKALTMGFKALATQTHAATEGSKAQIKAFAELGISHSDLKKHGNDLNYVLHNVADGMEKMPAGTDRAALSAKLFGRTWTAIAPLIRGGSKAMDEQLALADKYGVTLKGKTVKSVEDLVKAQRENKFATMGLQVAVGEQLIPALTKGVRIVSTFVAQMRSGTGAGGKFADKLKDIYEDAKPVVLWLAKAGKAVGDFAGKHPIVAKLAEAVFGVGLALKTLKFLSAATGFDSLLKAGGIAARGLKKVLVNAGIAGGSGAAEGAASSFGAQAGKFKTAGTKVGKFASRGLAIGLLAGIGLAATEAVDTLIAKIKSAIGGRLGDAVSEAIQSAIMPGGSLLKKAQNKVFDLVGIPHRAAGGVIPGTGDQDTVPVMATPGEYVVRKSIVNKYGPGFFDAINSGQEPQHFTSGGIIQRANQMDAMHLPYLWGGGHGGSGINRAGEDCSGAVSWALGVSPRVSGQFTGFGLPGPGSPNDTKVYANAEHVFAVFNGRGWGTSHENPGGGPGWLSYNSRPGFTVRHLEDGSAKLSGKGNAQEATESGKAKVSLSDRQAKAGSRLANKLSAPFAGAISKATRGAAGLATSIEDAGTSYGQLERTQGQSDEDLGTAGGRDKRISEISALKSEKAKQLSQQRKRAALLQTAITKTEGQLKALARARDKKGLSAAKRAAIRQRMRAPQDRLVDLKAELKALGFAIKDTQLDIGDLTKEAADVAATPDSAVDATDAPTPVDTASVQGDLISQALSDTDLAAHAGVITPEEANAQKLAMIDQWLNGALGPLTQRQTWELMADRNDILKAQTDSLTANTQAASEVAQALKDLQKSVDDQLHFAQSVAATENFQLTKSLADIISGQIAGFGVAGLRLTAGSGALARY